MKLLQYSHLSSLSIIIIYPLRASWHIGPSGFCNNSFFFYGRGISAQPPTWRASGITFRLAPTLRPVWLRCPCQEYKTPPNMALGVTGARKPPHHDKVAIPIEVDLFPYIIYFLMIRQSVIFYNEMEEKN